MKRIIQSILLATVLLLPTLSASAFTTRELSDVAWIATYTTNLNFKESYLSNCPLIDSHGVTAQRIDDTRIRLNGIHGCLDFIFTLTDANGNATSDGEYLCITANDYAVNISSPDYATQTWRILQNQRNGIDYWTGLYKYARTSDNFMLKITRDGDGYRMLSTSSLFVSGSADSSTSGYLLRIFEQLEFNSFVPNAWISDRYIESYDYLFNPNSTERLREYPVRVEMDYTNNRFSILNFGNNGYGLRESLNNYVNIQNSGLTSYSDGKFLISGSFDPTTKKLTFDTNQFAKPIWANYSAYEEYMFNFQLERLDLEGGTTVDELFGTFDDTKGVHHNSAVNGWVSNGGKRRTLEDISMEVETYTYYLNDYLWYTPNIKGGYYDTQISCGDVTLQTEYVKGPSNAPTRNYQLSSDPLAHVSYTQFNAGNEVGSEYYDGVKEWGIVPVMNVIRNEKYVDSYEIMAVPGSYTTAAEVQEHIGEAVEFRRVFFHQGTSLTQGSGKPVFKADELQNGLYKPGDFRIAARTSGAVGEPYTFFIRATYKPETGLTPTYHDVYPVTFNNDIPTSAEVIELGSFSVEGTHGALVIADAPADVTVCDLTGRIVYTGREGRVSLPAGVYIARCGRAARRVQVR